MKKTKLTQVITLILFVFCSFQITKSQTAFTAGNIAVLQAAASVSNTTASILELSGTAAGSPVQTIAVPSSGANSIRVSGSATSTCYLANSNDGSLLSFTGANSTDAATNVNALNPRAVVTYSPSGAFSIATTYTGGSGNQTRGATTVNNTNWFIGDQGGFYANSSTTASPTGNVRGIKAFGGTVYAFTASASAAPVGIISAASGGTYTALPGLASGATSRQDFYLVSSGSNGSAFDVLYVLDATGATAGTIFKYSLVSGSWTANGSYTTSFGGFGLAAKKQGTGAYLFVTTGTGATTANSVIRLTDAAGFNSTISITTANNLTLYTAATGTILKGVAFAPVPLSTISVGSLTPAGSFITTVGTASAVKTFTLSGSALTSNLTVSAVSAYEYSIDGFATAGQSSLSFSTANVSQTVSVRLTGASVGTFNGTITIASTGAAGSPATISLTGTVNPLTPTIAVGSLTPAGSFSTATGTPSAAKTFTLSGSNLTANLTVSAVAGYEYSIDGFATAGQSSLNFTTATVSQTVSVRLTGASAGTYNGTITIASTGATGSPASISVSGVVSAPTPVITVGALTPGTAFSANTGSPSAAQTFILSGSNLTANLTVSAVAGYEYSIDGFATAGQSSLTFTTASVSQTVSVRLTGTSAGTYNGTITIASTGATGSPASISLTGTVITVPYITEVLLPQYIEGINGTNSNRIPYACLLTINNLTANATYTYFPSVVIPSDGATGSGAGNCIFVSSAGFTRSSSPSLSSAGNYGSFTANSSGSYSGWFVIEPTGNATRFVPGTNINIRLNMNDGAGGTTVVYRPTTTNTATVLSLSGANTGTGLRGNSLATAKNFVVTYDNVNGTGRPISASFVESDGTANTTANSYAAFYNTSVEAVAGAYGVVVPNSNSNGIRRIEQRDITSGSVVGCVAIDADGVWPGGANTVNPAGGTTALVITSSDAPLMNITPSLSISASPSTPICTGTNVTFTAVATNGGSTPAYQWRLNGNPVGTGLSTYTNNTLSNSDVITCDLTSSAACASPTTATSNSLTTSVNTAPTISCIGNQTANTTSACSAVVTYAAPTVTGSPSPTITYSFSGATIGSGSGTGSGSTFNVGTTTVTLTATNTCGAPTCSFTVTVTDVTAPTISCAANVSVSSTSGMCLAIVTLTTPATSDNCGVASTTNNHTSTTYPLGTTTVIWTVTDTHGNTSTCYQTVTVSDNQAPSITCPTIANIGTDAGSCNSSASIGTATAIDNCSGTIVIGHSPAGPYSIGSTTVTWTATDANGNTASCSQTIIVTDNIAPVITCPATASLSTDAGLCTSSLSIGTPTAIDNCLAATITGPFPAGPYSLGTTTVIWSASDAAGNSATCSQTVIVTDNELPTIICPGNQTQTADAGACSAVINLTTPTFADNCGVASTISNHSSSTFPVGTTTITWIVTDVNGNTSTCNQTVTIIDNEAPSISCAAAVSLNNDLGNCSAVVTITAPTVGDNCAVATTVNNHTSTTYPLGISTVQWIVTDIYGNSNSCSQTVTVIDNEAPSITCAGNVVINNDAGLCLAIITLTSPTVGDNCGVATTVSDHALTTYPVGTTTVLWTVTDIHGNTNTCNQTVTVTDNEAPSITCATPASVNNDLGNCSAVVTLTLPTVGDNCGLATTVSDHASTTYPVGTTTVLWTVTDIHGNTNTCNQTVTVTDNEAPVITCPSMANLTTDLGMCTASGSIGTATAIGNCTGISVTHAPSGPYAIGSTTVIWTAIDGAGSTASCSQTIVVTDNKNPMITAPADVTVCTTTAPITVSVGMPTVTDNCAIVNFVNNAPATFGFGTTVVTWTATDNAGNTASVTQNVTVNQTPIGTNLATYICDGNSAGIDLNTSVNTSNCSFSWTATNTFGSVIGYNSGTGTTITDVLSNIGTIHGIVHYVVTPASDLGCIGSNFNVDVTAGVTPATPGIISGPSVVCGLSSAVYSIAPVADATTYTWTVPTGLTAMAILSGQGTTSITVSISAAILPSPITVTAGNGCGTSSTSSLSITRKPSVPGAISGPASACGLTNATYSITPVFGATSYTWVLPSGITVVGSGVSGTVTGLTETVNVNIASTFAIGNITVTAVNSCGSSTSSSSLSVTGKAPATPGTLNGPTSVCGFTTGVYSISSVAYASGYTWTVPSWMTITSGAGTTAITVTATGTPAAGTVSVAATNVCGTGIARSVSLTNSATLPGTITGPANICGVTTATYSIASLGAGYTYTWSLAMIGWYVGTTGTATTITTTSTSIVIHGPAAGSSGIGILKVTATNNCGATSGIRTLGVTYCHDGIANGNNNSESGATLSNLYPNPTSSDFKIDVTTDTDKDITVQIYDVLGNLIINEKHQITIGTNTLTTNIEDYKKGLYFVRLVDCNLKTVYSQTVIKQ
jgi:hypothetical protein